MTEESRGSIYVLLSTVFFTLNGVLVKEISGHMGSLPVSVIRFITGSLAGFLLLRMMHVPFRIRGWKVWSLRGILGCMTMVMYFKTIELGGVAWSTLVVNTSAFFIALNGKLFFGKELNKRTLAGIVLAFGGILIIYYSNRDISLSGTLLGLAVAFMRGFNAHLIKDSSSQNHPILVYMSATLFGLFFIPAAWEPMVRSELGILALACTAGIVVFAAQVMFTAGLKRMSPDKSSLLLFTGIPMALFAGYLRGEALSPRFFLGSLLIAGGIFIEIYLGRQKRALTRA